MTGTRYLRRGADTNGSVANFVETEQVFEFGGDQKLECSLVQIRGSVPMSWDQKPKSPYCGCVPGITPDVNMHHSGGQIPAAHAAVAPSTIEEKLVPPSHQHLLKLHFDRECMAYGKIVVMDLLKNTGKGNEPTLSNMFRDEVLKYSLDRECKLYAAAGVAPAPQPGEVVKYRAFDMHHECSKGWDKAKELVQLVDELDLCQMAAGNRTVSG